MTEAEIRAALAEIENKAWDDEAAHGLEDDLYYNFIAAICASDSEFRDLACLVLTSKDIDFGRWCG